MDSAEIDSLVAELESRVDRLRSLYDQYFMGIERLEPLVPRKDVERRLAVLRREQIRNTGTRFRFQMIVQRFNTYVTYWQRISRQIEQGTYKRDVMRAQARFGVNPTKERVTDLPPAEERSAVPSSSPPVIPDGPIEEVYELEVEPDFDEPARPAATSPAERFVSAAKLELDELADPFEEHDPFPKPPKPSAPRVRLAQPPGAVDARDTERRIPVAPAAAAPFARSGDVPAPPPSSRSLRPESRVVVTKRASLPDPLEAAPAAAAPPPSSRVAPPAAGSAPRVQIRAPAPAPPSSPQPEKPAAPPAPVPQARPPAVAPPQPKPAPPTPRAAPAPPSRIGDLSGDRFVQIYSQYVETRRKQNEPTGAITRDALAKQLDESTARLKQKHGGKAIDFEVVVKDGRTILRPVLK